MPSPRIASRCAKFRRSLVTWESAFFLTRFAAAGVVTACARMAGTAHQPEREKPS